MALLWAAHQSKPFYVLPQDITQEDFVIAIENINREGRIFMVEDENPAYQGFGAVAAVQTTSDGWKLIPHVEFFSWASPRNILRCTIAFLQKARFTKGVGVIVIYCLQDSVKLFEKCKQYGVLYHSGKIVMGDPRGDEYIFSIPGKRI